MIKHIIKTIFAISLVSHTTSHGSEYENPPKISCFTPSSFFKKLPKSSIQIEEEESEPWILEYDIGRKFAQDGDLFRAITCFKRASFLANEISNDNRFQIDYSICACYFFGKRYEDVIRAFEEKASFKTAMSEHSLMPSLLCMVYESYLATNQQAKAERIRLFLNSNFPEKADKLLLYKHFAQADIDALSKSSKIHSEETIKDISDFLVDYKKQRKNPTAAGILNAILPGAGYLYIGQKESALTSFCMNALFIAAAWELYKHNLIAPAIITIGFEAGWYIGGIRGSYLGAKSYNTELYSKKAEPLMRRNNLFPILMVEYGF